MNFIKRYGIPILFIMAIIIVLSLFTTALNYFDIINSQIVSILEIVIAALALFTGGLILGKKSTKKGWLQGLKLSLLFLFVLIIFNLIFLHYGIHLTNFFYYLILIASCILGSIIGINRNRELKK